MTVPLHSQQAVRIHVMQFAAKNELVRSVAASSTTGNEAATHEHLVNALPKQNGLISHRGRDPSTNCCSFPSGAGSLSLFGHPVRRWEHGRPQKETPPMGKKNQAETQNIHATRESVIQSLWKSRWAFHWSCSNAHHGAVVDDPASQVVGSTSDTSARRPASLSMLPALQVVEQVGEVHQGAHRRSDR